MIRLLNFAILVSLFHPLFVLGNNKRTQNIVGDYQFNSNNWLASVRVILNNDGTFLYYSGGDLVTYNSSGRWMLKGDTIVLNSDLLKNAIPIRVIESHIDSNENYINWSFISNNKGEPLNATIVLNCDTSNICEPFMYTNCNQNIGSIDSFYILYDNNIKSDIYYIKNKNCNKIDIVTLIDHTLWQYQFLEDEKFIFKNNKLFRVSKSSKNGYDIVLEKQLE